MSVQFACELQGQASWPVRLHSETPDVLLEELRRLLDREAVLDSFVIVFDAPVPIEVRERLTTTVLDSIRSFYTAEWGACEWTDDLVEETGWQGVRVTIDPALGPCFAGSEESGDRRHSGVWADDRTFLHVEVSGLSYGDWRPSSWHTTWADLAHWHPNSMTSGSWSDHLVLVDPAGGAAVLVGLRHMDEDGVYYSLSPRSPDAATTAHSVAEFIAHSDIGGVSEHLVPLLAHGFPADGSASEFRIDLLPDGHNPGYEISTLRVRPPQDVMDALLRLGTLDGRGARTMREAIVAGIAELWGADGTPADLGDEWYRVLARLEEVSR